ncbi:hypothetical protein ACFFSH_24455 [Streptomyces filamentosus]|uniref:hypothetical protein n=1 Tax=Streptomyces filamentosus TaxID=67294 RepID=UPI0016770BAF|nr:hypothetical protein [Streptomyces filamentosus]
MKNNRKASVAVRAALAASAALALSAAAPAAVAAPAADPHGLSCEKGKHNIDDYTGWALCTNVGSEPITFWVHLVCGWSPDVDGEHIRLAPGDSSQSTAHCSSLGSGIGEIQVRSS